MIRCLAIDDEPLALKQLAAYIERIPFLELAGCCQSALDARERMEETTVDALFIDINMPDLNGMEFVKSLSVPPLIVFTTAYSEYAVEGYKVDAVDYLLKPFTMDDMLRAAHKVKKQYDLVNTATLSELSDGELYLKTEHRVVRIETASIRYIEGMSEYLKIHLDKPLKPVTVLLSMKKMEDRLRNDSFMRIHRSYIINLKKIQEVNKNRVIMDADTYLPIGDMYRDTFTAYLESKFIGK